MACTAGRRLATVLFTGIGASIQAHSIACPLIPITAPHEATAQFQHGLPVLELPGFPEHVTPGTALASTAPFVIEAITQAVALAQQGLVRGIVTNPIQKSALYAAGFQDPGHTEFLARLAGKPPSYSVMMLAVPGLRVIPLTIHVPLKAVPALITEQAIRHVTLIAHQELRDRFGIDRPRLAVAGLNPHAGEAGGIGQEEQSIIAPALATLKDEGIEISGPYPADTLFHEEARTHYDAVLCMYHDQALIPLKTIDFHRGVNITLGLPFVRTSPDHGTALNIAGQNRARPDSLIAAIHMAAEMTR
ncbi:4-hydroxythreonine-4-phosphate dehydrogenase 2 [Iodidimonas gelatinilytica]|uniref:4-hydroxythreonine-4-phosphate dehydrogenase 2 n=1 Tax=Iodidimonas gelatinilytica TaxID=1236966 RepID=A0A5A7MPM9_9PROT|nr:4-hydroxythreonine-4-phosphate dehydrogenase PdxA [Iodidimonas gelatinilytica]GEQ96878.1 4-hydroxythreonine-4-phosphate dehydrogenase 2 [Iodidimonas gelatinilytica]